MNDDLTLLASAYLDGEATPDERARVEADPALLDEVERLRDARATLLDARWFERPGDDAREAAIAAALAAWDASASRPSPARRLRHGRPFAARPSCRSNGAGRTPAGSAPRPPSSPSPASAWSSPSPTAVTTTTTSSAAIEAAADDHRARRSRHRVRRTERAAGRHRGRAPQRRRRGRRGRRRRCRRRRTASRRPPTRRLPRQTRRRRRRRRPPTAPAAEMRDHRSELGAFAAAGQGRRRQRRQP